LDKELLNKCLNDDRRSQEQLYKLCYPMLIKTCLKYSNDKNQVILYFNIGFAKILLNLSKLSSEVPFEPWAKRVVINTILDEIKKEKRINEVVLIKEDLSHYNVNDREPSLNDYDQDRIELIKEKAKKLPPMTYKVFNLYAFDGYMHHEIASLLGINENTSMWHYSDAKKRIKKMLEL